MRGGSGRDDDGGGKTEKCLLVSSAFARTSPTPQPARSGCPPSSLTPSAQQLPRTDHIARRCLRAPAPVELLARRRTSRLQRPESAMLGSRAFGRPLSARVIASAQ